MNEVLLILIFVISFKIAFSHRVNITNENELEQFLCGDQPEFYDDTTVILSSSITHYIDNVSFCLINTYFSLELTSDSLQPAKIQCNDSTPTSGFAFTNVHILTLHSLEFSGCGGYLRQLSLINAINSASSRVCFNQHQLSVLVFVHIEKLLIENVNISTYYGFAIIAINPRNALIDNIQINGTSYLVQNYSYTNSTGSGLLLLYTDYNTSMLTHSVFSTSVKNAKFHDNYDSSTYSYCFTNIHHVKVPCFPLINAAGLTIIYSQEYFKANVQIEETKFTNNMGSFLGAMLILHYHTSLGKTALSNVKFVKNKILNGECPTLGSSLALALMNTSSQSKPLNIEYSIFDDLKDNLLIPEGSGAVFIGVYNPLPNSKVNVAFNNVTFSGNVIATTGSCLYAKTYFSKGEQNDILFIFLANITAYKNFQINPYTNIIHSANAKAGHFTLFNVGLLHLTGYNYFHDNSGSVFEITDTKIELYGKINFTKNKGERGPAFKLLGNSHLHIGNELNATFIENTALTRGGAIYAHDYGSNQCIFKIKSNKAKMHFINNTAKESGSSIYSNNLYNCIASDTIRNPKDAELLYNQLFKFVSFTHHNNVSTFSVFLCACSNKYTSDRCSSKCTSDYKSNLNVYEYNKIVYAGQSIKLYMAAKDEFLCRIQYSVVSFSMGQQVSTFVNSLSSWEVSPIDVNQALQESGSCTEIQVRLHQKRHNISVSNAVLVASSLYNPSVLIVKLKLSDCPIGFKLDIQSGKCTCSTIVLQLGKAGTYSPVCYISSDNDNSIPTITSPPDSAAWLGILKLKNNNTVIGTSLTCSMHCNRNKKYSVFAVNMTTVVIANPKDLNNSMPLCLDNREGALCSQCSPGYSVVFGSAKCKKCSNWWLLIAIYYALVGPLFIYLLYALNLTLTTGTLNGIIFCFQVLDIFFYNNNIDVPSCEFIRVYFLITKSLFLFFNYSFSFPVCFYNGMTELWKSGLTLLFPVYLLAIVILLIIVSRYSIRISNKIADSSLQVLITVVHLSFAKLILSLMEVFASADIYLQDSEFNTLCVWFNNGTIEYGKGGHLILMTVTSLIVGPILIMYMIVLLGGRILMKVRMLREYIRPIYEAIHAPYKYNKEFFFTTRLLLIVVLYAMYVLYRGHDVYAGYAVFIPLFSIYVALESLCRPFKSMSLNIFNFVLLSFLASMIGCSWYFLKINSSDGLALVLSLSSTAVIASLFGVIAYHMQCKCGIIKKLKLSFALHSLQPTEQNKEIVQNYNTASNIHVDGSFFQPCNRVREPLLLSQHAHYN